MRNIKKLYDEHLNAPFPDVRGREVLGIDLALIDSDTAGLIERFISHRGQLDSTQLRLLCHCHADLKVITNELKGATRLYFSRLQNLAGLVIENVNSTATDSYKESYRKDWEPFFFKVRAILNKWDPLGVADAVEDEYDGLNFRILTVLFDKGDTKQLQETLKNYLQHSMSITADREILEEITQQIATVRST